MESTVDWVHQREIEPECSTSLQRSRIVTDGHIQSLCHSYTLHGHEGCVNTIAWNESGTLLASGSDDQKIMIWQQNGRLLRKLPTAHTNNIFSVLFVPQARDHLVLSAAGDSQIILHDLDNVVNTPSGDGTEHIQRWECGGRVKKLAMCGHEPRTFWSVSEDGMLKQFDLRNDCSINFNFLNDYGPLKSLAINEAKPEMLALGISSAQVPIYDRRNMGEPMIRLSPAHLSLRSEGRHLATSLAFNQLGDELLVNIGSDNIYIFNVLGQSSTSPDLFSTLSSFISEDAKFPLTKSLERNGTILARAQLDEKQFSDKVKRSVDAGEFSQAIDGCSEWLALYADRNKQLFALQTDKLEKLVEQRVRTILAHDLSQIAPYLITRGRCLLERDWEGDKIDAIRDFLSLLRISPSDKEAHSNLLKCLYKMKQQTLARQCFSLYTKLHPNDATMEGIVKKLEEEKSEEEEYPEWTSQTGQNCRNYTDRYTGHLNINTDIKEATWFGGHDQYIIAGSDCGSIFIWERKTQRVVRALKGDNYTVNCVQPHPRRCLFASSGIDNVIRFWEPSLTAMKTATERNEPEESEDRDITATRYDLMKRNRRKRTPELVWEQLMNTVGLGLFQVGPNEESAGDGDNEGEDDDSENGGNPQVIWCRQM